MTVQDVTNQKLIDFNLENINILILDDDPIASESLKNLLEELGFVNIFIVAAAKEAIKLLAKIQKHFDLIMTDYHLPDMKGSEFARYYRNVSPKQDTPIICYSSAIEKCRRECIEAGIDDFISKPVTLEKLRELLECWIVVFKQSFNLTAKNMESKSNTMEA